jgi:dihydroflavonol-4-reductase
MYLITGSTGLLGGHLLYALLQKQERVAALKRPSSKMDTLREIFSYYSPDPDGLFDRIDWRTGDLLDKESLIRALEGINCVINCAATVSFRSRDKKSVIVNNVLGTRNLAEAIRIQQKEAKSADGKETTGNGAQKTDGKMVLIHVSSTSALGDGPGYDPKFLIDEDTPRNLKLRHTGYSVSKSESEKVLHETGVKTVILNPGIILGPGQWGKGSSQLFVKAWQGIRYYPYGGTGYVDVRDVAAIITEIGRRVSDTGCEELGSYLIGERFCVVGKNLRYRDFFNLVTDEYGKPNPHIFAGRLMTGIAWRAERLRSMISGHNPQLTREIAEASQRISYYSSEKIRKILNFDFRPVEDTIEWVSSLYRKSLTSNL